MITDITVRGGVYFPKAITTGLIKKAVRFKIIEECNRHTLFQVTFAGHPKYQESFKSGQPMRLLLTSQRGGTRTWHGYVDNFEVAREDDLGPVTKVIGVGVTYPMKQPNDAVLDNKVLDAERSLIRGFGLTPLVRGKDVNRQTLMSGQSAWKTLTDMAKTFDQYVFATGTTINVLQMSEIMNLYYMEAVELTWKGVQGEFRDQDTLRKFQGKIGDNASSLGLLEDRKISHGVDPVSARVTRVDSGTSMFPSYRHSIARSPQNVAAQISGPTVLRKAEAEGRGHGGVVAGKIVKIKGAPPYPYWFVSKVMHNYDLKSGTHDMEMELFQTREMELPYAPNVAQRNVLRTGDGTSCVCKEHLPTLIEINSVMVDGTHDWANGFRWQATPC
jgi:hypothetical protein